jgi:4-oxalmesaconate hydratase
VIIDIHAHFTQRPMEIDAYRGMQISMLHNPKKGSFSVSDESIEKSLRKNFQQMADKGIDRLVFSPTAGRMGHDFGNELISRYWAEVNNDVVGRACQLFPDKLIPCGQLPQSPRAGLAGCLEEMERCVETMDFVAFNINPDISGGVEPLTPSLASEWWYPLWEKMVQLDVVGMIHASSTLNPALHSTGSHYINVDTAAVVALCNSKVFDTFPKLKLVIPHGGGAIPYQWPRHQALHVLENRTPFEEVVKNLYFDMAIYDQLAMEVLIKRMGVDNVLFSTEMLGTAKAMNPKTGKLFDDTAEMVKAIEWLSPEDKYKIFEGNARKLYSRAKW